MVERYHRYYADHIIDVYEEKRLNVAYNLALFIVWYSKIPKPRLDNEYFSIQEIIDSSKRNCPRYAKYADDVEKYLLLM